MIQGPSPKGQGPCSIRLQFMENIQTRFLDMKLFKFSVAALLALATAFLGGCSDDDGIDNRDRDYGYVQFKLHKEASYDAVSRAQKPQLDYLSEASKVQVSLYYDGTTITQSLTLSASVYALRLALLSGSPAPNSGCAARSSGCWRDNTRSSPSRYSMPTTS